MRIRNANIRLTIVIICFFFGIVLLLSINGISTDQTDATYIGSEQCKLCHSNQYDSWSNTIHGTDFANDYIYHGNLTNKYTYCGDSMLPCHTVGYGEVEKDGFNPAYSWDSAENANLLGIGCENCHGPGSEHISSSFEDKINTVNQIVDQYAGTCGGSPDAGCHGSYRQYGNETISGWSETSHATEAPEYAQRLDCSHCLSTEGAIAKMEGNPLTELPEEITWSITCAACHDPHPDSATHFERQLRTSPEEICEECHYTTSELGDEEVHHPTKEMREGMGGIDVSSTTYMADVSCVECHMYTSPRGTPANEAKQSHSWTPQPETCVECHDGVSALPEYNYTTAEEEIEQLKEDFQDTYDTVIVNIDLMKDKKAYAINNSIWTNEMNDTYYEAVWNFGLAASDGSNGVHNPEYAEALMLDANTKALQVIDAVDTAPIPDDTPGFEVLAFIATLCIAALIFWKRKNK